MGVMSMLFQTSIFMWVVEIKQILMLAQQILLTELSPQHLEKLFTTGLKYITNTPL